MKNIIFNSLIRLIKLLHCFLQKIPFFRKFLNINDFKLKKYWYKILGIEKAKKEWGNAKKNLNKTELLNEPKGINLLGYLSVAKGLGEAARGILSAIQYASIPVSIIDYKYGISKKIITEKVEKNNEDSFKYLVNLIHLNPPQLPFLWFQYDHSLLVNKYSIGIWYWELPNIPNDWLFALDYFDEFWVGSKFIFDSLSKVTDKPIFIFPPAINLIVDKSFLRKDFSLPEEKFLFLCVYDVLSSKDRKNPMAVINSFKEAFSKDDETVGLVIKVNNGHENPFEINQLKESLNDYRNYYIIDEVFEKSKLNRLIQLCDVFVSLHRAEGLGLVMAEAMLLGIPTIATNWSANVDFMNSENSCLVDSNLISVIKYNEYIFEKEEQFWADPKIERAVEYMKRLRRDIDFYNEISKNGKKSASEYFSQERISKLIINRLKMIYEK